MSDRTKARSAQLVKQRCEELFERDAASAEALKEWIAGFDEPAGPANRAASIPGGREAAKSEDRETGFYDVSRPLARIRRQRPSPTQSGRAGSSTWILEFEGRSAPKLDPLMGWTGSGDSLQQVRLRFPTRERAIAFARVRGLRFVVEDRRDPARRPKGYADNFRNDRRTLWTH